MPVINRRLRVNLQSLVSFVCLFHFFVHICFLDFILFQISFRRKRARLLSSWCWRAFITNVFLLMQAFKMIRQEKLSHACELLIMDWAMKFLPIGYRETQRDWFGKKGKPWHITVAINKADSEEIEVCLMLKQYLWHSFFQVSIQLFNKIWRKIQCKFFLHTDCTNAKIWKGEFIRVWTTNCPEAKTKKCVRDSGLNFCFFSLFNHSNILFRHEPTSIYLTSALRTGLLWRL